MYTQLSTNQKSCSAWYTTWNGKHWPNKHTHKSNQSWVHAAAKNNKIETASANLCSLWLSLMNSCRPFPRSMPLNPCSITVRSPTLPTACHCKNKASHAPPPLQPQHVAPSCLQQLPCKHSVKKVRLYILTPFFEVVMPLFILSLAYKLPSCCTGWICRQEYLTLQASQ